MPDLWAQCAAQRVLRERLTEKCMVCAGGGQVERRIGPNTWSDTPFPCPNCHGAGRVPRPPLLETLLDAMKAAGWNYRLEQWLNVTRCVFWRGEFVEGRWTERPPETAPLTVAMSAALSALRPDGPTPIREG